MEVGIEASQDQGVLLRVEDRGPGWTRPSWRGCAIASTAPATPRVPGLGLAIVETITRRLAVP